MGALYAFILFVENDFSPPLSRKISPEGEIYRNIFHVLYPLPCDRIRESHNRLEDTKSDHTDDECHHEENHWLDQLLERLDRDVDLTIVEFCDFHDRLIDSGSFFSDLHHLYEKIRKKRIIFESISDLDTISYIFTEKEETLAVDFIIDGISDDSDRLDD